MSALLRLSKNTSSRLIQFNKLLKNQPDLGAPRICPFCKNVEIFSRNRNMGVMYHNNIQYSHYSTFTNTNEHLTAQPRGKRKRLQKTVEIIRAGNKDNPAVLEGRATVKSSSPVKVLKKLGITTSSKISSLALSEEGAEVFDNEQDLVGSETNLDVNPHDDFYDFYANGDVASSGDLELALMKMELGNETDELIADDLAHVAANAFAQADVTQKVKNNVEKNKKKQLVKKFKKKKPEMSGEQLKTVERELKRKGIQNNMLSYLDVCINSNMVPLADRMLFYFHRTSRNSLPLDDVRLYNTVLRGWAAQGKWSPFSKVLMVMEQQNPQPDLQSYVLAIECAYRAHKKELIDEILQEIKKTKRFDINNILRDCKFVGNQKELVLKAIRLKIPDFEPILPQKPQGYVCNLLQPLNETEKLTIKSLCSTSLLSAEKLKELSQKQLEVEIQAQVLIESIEKKPPITAYTIAWRRKLEKCETTWRDILTNKFEQTITDMERKATDMRSKAKDLLPYLKCLDKQVYVETMFQELTSLGQLSECYSSTITELQNNFGNKIMERYLLQKKEKLGILREIKKYYNDYCAYFTDPTIASKYTPRQYWEYLQTKYSNGPDIDQPDKLWPPNILLGIGEILYNIILQNIKFDNNLMKPGSKPENLVSAFYQIYRRHDLVKIRGEIKPHPGVAKLYKLANRDGIKFEATVLPMVSPPLPWISIHSGGFLASSAKIIRFPRTASRQRTRIKQMNPQQLYPAFDSLNQLGECPWIINKPILDLVIGVFNNNGSVELDIPQPISECPAPPQMELHMSKEEMAKVMREQNRLKQQKAEMYSLWCDMLYKLSIANQFRDEIMWFPHNMDFRGRVYPCPPHFNHLGGDVSRSMLLFARGEPLGEEGLKWLKIHLVNLTGLMKRGSLQNRLDFFEEKLPEIMDSADNPLTGKGWWKKSDEPWQTLACCVEVAKALRSPEPSKYVSHFPIHQDGSCNGLQHYAALGRDLQGAIQVNLEPSNMPQDVYSGVAKRVERERRNDAAVGIKIAQVLEGFITRKVVKQPVMTTVYGVTRYGAKLQILRQLKDIADFPQEYAHQAASYLVGKTFFSLREMFSATKEIQDWFTLIAGVISNACEQPVEWETPIGLPVIQPYFKMRKPVYQKINNRNVKVHQENDLPNTRKQKNAFPPNYIHSLDSTHMMLTSLFCQREGITFVSVHDCFWTHPNTVAQMNRICREQFIALHKEPLLENLSEQLVKIYKSDLDMCVSQSLIKQIVKIFVSVPQKGTFDLNRILQSTYFFS